CFVKNISKFDEHGITTLSPGQFRAINESKVTTMPPAQLVMGFAFLWKVKTDNIYSQDENENEDRK
ncbi:hypothetical protein, partial [Streptomyces afghaniensis]|uniref:hypothetical protein n=1 Tax=Streptomyces afghaniensis TaxID=66865 RepID=UPI001427A961